MSSESTNINRLEPVSGNFECSFQLHQNVEIEAVNATDKNGVLAHISHQWARNVKLFLRANPKAELLVA